MGTRIDIPLSIDDRAAVRSWARRTMIATAIAAAAAFALPRFAGDITPPPAANAAKQAPSAECAEWDTLASEALARLVRGQGDTELRQANGAIFLLRRARRNCQAGWLKIACQDFQAVVRTAGAFDPAPPPQLSCNVLAREATIGDARD